MEVDDRVRWRQPRAGKASDYLNHFSIRYPGEPIVLACRVSERVQHRRGNHTDQAAEMTAAVNAAGGRVIAPVTECGPGWDPSWLANAAALARLHGARILAESTDRLIRSDWYHSKRSPDAQATEHDLRCMALWLDGVEAMTLLPPDATPEEVRSYQRKRGQTAKGNKGGRPTNKAPGRLKLRRETQRPRAIELRAAGATLANIIEETGVPRRTIQRWLANAKCGAPFFAAGRYGNDALVRQNSGQTAR